MRVKVNVIEFHALPPVPRVFCEEQKKNELQPFRIEYLDFSIYFPFFFSFFVSFRSGDYFSTHFFCISFLSREPKTIFSSFSLAHKTVYNIRVFFGKRDKKTYVWLTHTPIWPHQQPQTHHTIHHIRWYVSTTTMFAVRSNSHTHPSARNVSLLRGSFH